MPCSRSRRNNRPPAESVWDVLAAPQTLIRERATGSRFQVPFEIHRLGFRIKGQIRTQPPRSIRCGAHILPSVMIGESLLEVLRISDVALVTHGRAFDKIHVVHGTMVDEWPTFAKATAGSLRKIGAAVSCDVCLSFSWRASRSSKSEGWRRGWDSNRLGATYRITSKARL